MTSLRRQVSICLSWDHPVASVNLARLPNYFTPPTDSAQFVAAPVLP